MYVADDQSAASGGGVAKWTFNGTTWTAGPIFADGVGTAGVLGLTAIVTGANVTLVATTGEVSLNRIIVYVDDGVTTNPTGAVIATAATNTIFRGVAPAPQ